MSFQLLLVVFSGDSLCCILKHDRIVYLLWDKPNLAFANNMFDEMCGLAETVLTKLTMTGAARLQTLMPLLY